MSKQAMTTKVSSMEKLANASKGNYISKQTANGIRIIWIIPGFKVKAGSELLGSPVMLQDPKTGSLYRFIEKADAKALADSCLKEAQDSMSEANLKIVQQKIEELYSDIESAKSVFQKMPASLTFRFA